MTNKEQTMQRPCPTCAGGGEEYTANLEARVGALEAALAEARAQLSAARGDAIRAALSAHYRTLEGSK